MTFTVFVYMYNSSVLAWVCLLSRMNSCLLDLCTVPLYWPGLLSKMNSCLLDLYTFDLCWPGCNWYQKNEQLFVGFMYISSVLAWM